MLESESSIIWATVKERMGSRLGKVEAAYSLLPSAGSGTEDLAGRGTKIMFCQDNRHLTRGRGELHVFFLMTLIRQLLWAPKGKKEDLERN